MPSLEGREHEPTVVTELDSERYSPEVIAAYRKIMELAEVDPNADSYKEEDEAKDL